MRALALLLLVGAPCFALPPNVGIGTANPSVPCTGTAGQIAACLTVQNNPYCLYPGGNSAKGSLGPLYTEIDNATTKLWSFQVGTSIGPYTLVQMDSASKPIYGAYVLQSRLGVNNLTASDVQWLHQSGGTSNMPSSCPAGTSINACVETYPGVNSIQSLGAITSGGSGYTNGSHLVNLTGGTGSSATARASVTSGVIQSLALANNGTGYSIGDMLSAAFGGGSGLAVSVASISCYPNNALTSAVTGDMFPQGSYGAQCQNCIGVFCYNGANFETHAALFMPASFTNLTVTPLAPAVNTTLQTPTLAVTFTAFSATITNSGNNALAAGMHVYLTGSPLGFSDYSVGRQLYYVLASGLTSATFQLAACAPGNGSCSTKAVAPTGSGTATMTIMPFTYSSTLLPGGANQSGAGAIAHLKNIINGTLSYYKGAIGGYEITTNYSGNGEPNFGQAGNYAAYGAYAAQVLHGTALGTPFGATNVTSSTTLTAINANIGTLVGPFINGGQSQAAGSPIPENFLYSMAIWIESDPVTNGDGTASGIGAKGFYTWIDPTQTYVGVLARVGSPGSGYYSMECGRLLRRAYLSGIQQTGPFPVN